MSKYHKQKAEQEARRQVYLYILIYIYSVMRQKQR